MLKLTDKHTAERYEYGWKLHTEVPTDHPKAKNPTTTKTTYWSALHQVFEAILDQAAGAAQSAEELKALWEQLAGELKNAAGLTQ